MSMDVTVRVVLPGDDVTPCAEMLSRVMMQTEAAVLMDGLQTRDPGAVPIAGLCLNPDHELLVAEYSLTIIGMARVRLHPGRATNAADWYCEPGVVAFDLCMVEPGLRGMGVGQILLDAVLERAATHGADELACDLPASAEEVIRRLRARGFRPVERISRDSDSRVVLSRTLDERARERAA